MCALLVGLPNVVVCGVGEWPSWLRVDIETCSPRPECAGCGAAAWDHGQREVLLVDLPSFGRPTRLAWRKQRWRCPSPGCVVVTWSEQDPTIASSRCALTTRAARWATRQVGKHGRVVSEVADDLACDWHTGWSPTGVASTAKADGSPVTAADIAAEEAMRTHLFASCPADGFVGEEIGEIIGTSGRRWIVDGIDGTRFFATGQRVWGTLIALEREGEIVVGVSSSPAQQQRWWAARGGGAFTSGAANGGAVVRLHVSRSRALRPARVATLPGFDRMAADEQQIIEGLLGAPAVDRTWSHQNQVASADLDACIWFGGDLWDHAAPSILVEEAGGKFTDHQGGHRLDTRTAVYSNGLIHDHILNALAR